jgi:transcription elongation factor GreA
MTTFISAEGLEHLKEELQTRKKKTRGEISERIASAKELGDLSENFEYHEAKEQQSLNESRIMELESMIQSAEVVKQTSGGNVIGLGTSFVVEMPGKKTKTFEIVGSSDADPLAGKISNESPLGQAFMGRGAGETVEVTVPSGVMKYKIKKIK